MYFNCINTINESYEKYVITTTSKEINFPDFFSENIKNSAKKLLELEELKEDEYKKLELNLIDDDKLISLIILYLGNEDKLNSHNIREYLYSGLKNITGKILFLANGVKLITPDLMAEISEHINYKFDKYLSEKKEKFLNLNYLIKGEVPEIIEGVHLAKISTIIKNLINEPAEVMNPKQLASQALELGELFGFEVEILDEDKAFELGMTSYLSVARAAHHRPYVIVMRYNGDSDSKYKFGLVGKGLTYDTGGLSLKPTSGMVDMKEDMGGSATIIGTMCAVASMKLKKNVVAVVAACENSIGPNAYRPGDIIETMNGKTVEVTNTDAEGRMTLIDALTYIIRCEEVDEVIDAATLTGAIMVAIGEEVTGVFTNNDEMARKLIAASKNWHEDFWLMPMFDSYKRYLKSPVADLKNSTVRWGGAITAAKFLEEFVEDKKWIHLDIAGTVFDHGSKSKYYDQGPTAQVFRTIYTYIKEN